MDTKVVIKDSSQVEQVLIQWELSDPEEATWEDVTWIKQTYPQFKLEDKVVFKGKGNVTCAKEKWTTESINKDGHVTTDRVIKKN